MFGTVDIKCRPLKLAYLVSPNNKKQVREAIQLSSTLWGGKYFPIIPLYERMPATWRDGPLKASASEEVVLGLLDAYDSDVLVNFTGTVPDYISKTGIEIIKPHEIWGPFKREGRVTPKFGIGIFEMLNDIFDLHFRYKAKYPVKVIFPTIPKVHSVFWASWFGEISEDIMPALKKRYFDPLEITTEKISLSRLGDILKRDVLFPRRIVDHGIRSYSKSGTYREAYVFYMDATKLADVVDFWNLRAAGKHVLPVPKQLKDHLGLQEVATHFLKTNKFPMRYNKDLHVTPGVLCSRNIPMKEMEEYAKKLEIEDDGSSSGPPFFLYRSYPRIWDEWGREADFASPDDIYAEEESSIEITDKDEPNIRFHSLLPSFADEYGYHGEPRCANELTFRFYGSSEPIAEAFPKFSGKEFNRAIAGLTSHIGEWRVGRNGLVKLVKNEYNETRDIPFSEKLIFAWLKDSGWEATLSAPGILAKQIYRKLEGNAGFLRQEKLLTFFEHMNGGSVQKNGEPIAGNRINQERELSVGEVKNTLKSWGLEQWHERLTDDGIFRLGVKLQCPHCTRKPWFTLDQVQDTFTCPRCLNKFPAVGNFEAAEPYYKTAGPFSVRSYADGAYAVLLTLDFFNDHNMSSLHITPALSFIAKANGKGDIEADLAALWQESAFREQHEGILFAECKTYGNFEKKDFDRMQYIAKTFPGAVLVFSTLRKELGKKEIREITRIAKAGRKYWKVDRPINPVLVLTGAELFSQFGPPNCWEDDVKEKFRNTRELLSLCDATQQIYLGLPSWHEDWRKEWEKRRVRKKK